MKNELKSTFIILIIGQVVMALAMYAAFHATIIFLAK